MILTIQPLKLTKPSPSPFHSIRTAIFCEKKAPFRRRKYNSSRRSVLKKTFIQEQVKFTAPVSDDPVVAIIGGGMSGLLCALFLEKRGVRSTVFDTVYIIYGLFTCSVFSFGFWFSHISWTYYVLSLLPDVITCKLNRLIRCTEGLRASFRSTLINNSLHY